MFVLSIHRPLNKYYLSYSVPNPPGPIIVESQTVHSINFTWPFPDNMDLQQYSFIVYTLNSRNQTDNNFFLLDELQSGSSYTITVTTESVFNYESTAVTALGFTSKYD